jgi:membrane protein DedA with SNARE-associated domain
MLADLFEAFAAGLESLVETFGLPGVVMIALFENLFPPTPSEFLYPLAGKLVYDGHFNAVGVIIAGVLGSLMGSLVYYSIGYWLGEAHAREAIARYGSLRLWRWSVILASVEDYDRAVALFQRWGGPLVLVARLVPLVHSVVSIPAGVVRMRLLPFILYTALGSFLWIMPLTLFGMWLGSQWEKILYYMDVYTNVWYGLIGAALVYWIARRVWAVRRQASP